MAAPLTVGQEILQLRGAAGLSQNDLALLLNVPQPRIWEWENNVHAPRLLTFMRLRKVCEEKIRSNQGEKPSPDGVGRSRNRLPTIRSRKSKNPRS